MNVKVELDSINNIYNYDELIDNSLNGTHFAYSWFLKLKNTDKVLKFLKDGKLFGIMPLFLNEDGKTICQSTMYIPYGGIVFFELCDDERNKIRLMRESEYALSNYLKEHFETFSFSIDPYIKDVMSFIRQGIFPEVRYTYVIDLTYDIDTIREAFGQDRKKEIRRCIRNGLEFVLDKDIKYFSPKNCVSWEQKYGFPSSANFVNDYVREAIKMNRGMCFVAKQGETVYGAVFIAWDKSRSYILYSYYDHSKDKDIGVMSFLYYNAFKYLKSIGISKIDFEGSVYESVENFNISFGAYQERYYNMHYDANRDFLAKEFYEYYEK